MQQTRVERGGGEEQSEVFLTDGDVGRLHAALHDGQNGAAEKEVRLVLQKRLHCRVEGGLDADCGGLEATEKESEEDGGESEGGRMAEIAAME